MNILRDEHTEVLHKLFEMEKNVSYLSTRYKTDPKFDFDSNPTVADSQVIEVPVKPEEDAPYFRRYMKEVESVHRFNAAGTLNESSKVDKSDQNIGRISETELNKDLPFANSNLPPTVQHRHVMSFKDRDIGSARGDKPDLDYSGEYNFARNSNRGSSRNDYNDHRKGS